MNRFGHISEFRPGDYRHIGALVPTGWRVATGVRSRFMHTCLVTKPSSLNMAVQLVDSGRIHGQALPRCLIEKIPKCTEPVQPVH